MSNQSSYFFEPHRLLVIWQSSLAEVRTRFVVGELIRCENCVSLSYFPWSSDYLTAETLGFEGHPAFPRHQVVHHHNVMEVLSRRLPPRSRSDFGFYLKKYGLAEHPNISDFGLLGYTAGILPSDGFSFAINLGFEAIPLFFPMECAGFRFYDGMQMEFDSVSNFVVEFRPEDGNAYDPFAVAIYLENRKLGFVPRYYSSLVRIWLHRYNVFGFTSRIMGSIGSPKLLLNVSISNKQEPKSIS